MTRRTLRFILPAVLAVPLAAAASFGGWSTVTLEDVPEYLRAKQPVALTLTVRQHGVERQSRLEPSVEARSGSLTARAEATPGKQKGEYTASLTVPQSGEWTITLNSGYGDSKTVMLPLRAIDAGAPAPAPMAASERGKHLFVAKSCGTCHIHTAVDAKGKAGPDLSAMRFPPDYLAQFLADPSIKKSTNSNKMPDLELKPAEIAALVGFINTDRQAMR